MKKHVAAVLTAGVLWGFMGMFTRRLGERGFSSSDALIVRFAISCLLFFVTLLISDPKLFRIKLKDLWCFIGAGIFSLLFFSYCYFRTIELVSLSTAAILLYTAPSMVMLMSLVFFKERLTLRKTCALIMAFIGCCLVSGIASGEIMISTMGLALGLCSGLGYALFSIFSRFALNRGYDSKTINFYATFIALAGALVIWSPAEPFRLMFSSGDNLIWCSCTGLISCYLPYLLYTYSLTGLESGKASVMASAEPVVATITGIILFDESLDFFSLLGILLVLGAIVVLNLGSGRKDAAVSSPE